MPLLYIPELECSQDYVMIFADHTTKDTGIIFLIFVVYFENNSPIF